jgi:methionyl-tRNA synthetase
LTTATTMRFQSSLLLRARQSAALGLSKPNHISSRLPWVCNSCNGFFSPQRLFSTTSRSSDAVSSPESSADASSSSPQKPYYITTPIFYVNAAPHIGHLHTMVLADVLKRWHNISNPSSPRALLSTGTDEHGLKVQQAAEAASVTPQALCDANSQRFRDLAASANVKHDFFVRTTDEAHRAAVQHFWEELVAQGHVYSAPRNGWYSVSDECFYKDEETERRAHPRTGVVTRVATATANEVTWTEEENYHFRLTAFKDRLLELYRKNPNLIKPAERQNEVVSWIETSLSDLSISRPSSRLQWGVPVPNDPSQTVYVWVDALINYIVQAGYPSSDLTSPNSPWPADVHVIGKDILRFHCVYWPALLMATNLPLPRSFLTHAHWTISKRKMSKSLGNVVDPFKQLQRWGADPLRYFLMAEAGAMTDDKGYGNDRVMMRYRELLSMVGNVYQRVRTFGAGRCVRDVLINKVVPLVPDPATGQKPPKLLGMVEELPGRVRGAMAKTDIPTALKLIVDTLGEVHSLFSVVNSLEIPSLLTYTPVPRLHRPGRPLETQRPFGARARPLRLHRHGGVPHRRHPPAARHARQDGQNAKLLWRRARPARLGLCHRRGRSDVLRTPDLARPVQPDAVPADQDGSCVEHRVQGEG